MYILIVDDDQLANSLMQFILQKEGFEVETTDNPRATLQMIQKREPDLLILDLMMPYINGFEFVERLRDEGYETPFMFVSAQDGTESILRGFALGAEEYICKPFNYQVLAARVHVIHRHLTRGIGNSKMNGYSLHIGTFKLFPSELRVVIAGYPPIALSLREMQVLQTLMNTPGKVIGRDQLLAEVWNGSGSSNLVDAYVRRLRRKLQITPESHQQIVSVRGTGYKFVEV